MKTWLVLAVLITAAGGSPVAKRSDDSDPLQAVVSRLSSDLQTLQAKVTALSNLMDIFKVKVGFSASVNHEFTAGSHVIVKLDDVHYNEGNAYEPRTGFFTAPIAGMYSFSIKTEIDAQNQVALSIMKEGSQVLYIYGSDHDSYQTPSAEVVLHLAQGEKVWVETATSSKIRTWTRFDGFLVHPDA